MDIGVVLRIPNHFFVRRYAQTYLRAQREKLGELDARKNDKTCSVAGQIDK